MAEAITDAEVAHILGCALSTVTNLVNRGDLAAHGKPFSYRRLSRMDAERLALQRWHPRQARPGS